MNELIFLFVGIAVLLAIMLCRAKWREILAERDGTAETLDEANTDHRSYMVLKIENLWFLISTASLILL